MWVGPDYMFKAYFGADIMFPACNLPCYLKKREKEREKWLQVNRNPEFFELYLIKVLFTCALI